VGRRAFKHWYSDCGSLGFLINRNKHLQEIPETEKVVAVGYNVTEINAILLHKVEVLIIYLI